MTTAIRLEDIKKEIVNYLRSQDVLTTTQRSVTTTSQTFTATAGQTVFTLTYEPRNIRTLTVAAASKYYFKDYSFDGTAKTLTLYTGASVGEAVVVSYDYGTTGAGGDRIYPDYPREDLTFKSFPRIAVEVTSQSTNPLGLGASYWLSDIIITIFTWSPAERISSIGGVEYLNDLVVDIREKMISYSKSFNLFKFIKPLNVTSVMKGNYDKVIQQNQDFMIPYVVE